MKVVAVCWKDEDEIDGQPVGPLTIVREGDLSGPRPFDPDRNPDPWVTLAEARAIAAEHGLDLETS